MIITMNVEIDSFIHYFCGIISESKEFYDR
jgi:hypothetical protein